jgi:hypothetical protein
MGKPIWDAPRVDRPTTVLDTDHEFDAGSGMSISALTKLQIDNLVTLGKVWGFLKYYHPKVTSGDRHWDYDLFRVLPKILAAPDRAAANAALQQWIDSLGSVSPCHPCAKLDNKDLYFKPDLDWISNQTALGSLSLTLQSIRDNHLPDKQFYVSKDPEVGNPKFDHEPGYPILKFPDPGFQLLSLYRFWNIVEYWSPNRDIVGEDWHGVLAEFIPRFALAKSSEDYQREVMALLANAHDGHANIWSSLKSRPPVGKCQIPVNVRFVENQPVIGGFPASDVSSVGGLQLGDVITELDGVPTAKLIAKWSPYYSASNEAARLRDLGRYLTRGDCGDTKIRIHRGADSLTITTKRVSLAINDFSPGTHDLPGPAFRLLSRDVAYLELSSVKDADAASHVQQAAGTKGLVVDIRNYPSSTGEPLNRCSQRSPITTER